MELYLRHVIRGGRWVYDTAKTVPAYIRAGAKSGICCMTCIPSKLI